MQRLCNTNEKLRNTDQCNFFVIPCQCGDSDWLKNNRNHPESIKLEQFPQQHFGEKFEIEVMARVFSK